ncbi:MAG TPA: sugar phosphate isomerase/epimerase family protein [Terriglobales bacterium]|nr:sugar phosphate isomerase/epimerase family protein [Terriglobales bacterium]
MEITRRSFVALSATLPFAMRAYAKKSSVPIGLELYSVRDELQKDTEGTVRAVAQMGYQCVEFYSPYFDWTEPQARSMRKLLDDLGIHCYSTHNSEEYFSKDKISKARDLNLTLGTKYMVMASSNPKPGIDGWKAIADELNSAADFLAPAGLKTGYHNHQPEFKTEDGVRPIEVLAKNTKPSVMLQLDVGTCLNSGGDPVAWIRSNPGRIRSIHLKDWSSDPAKGYQVLFGEGDAKWKEIFAAAESVGGVEYYLLEQEGSRFGELETAKRCLEAYHKIHGA